MVLNAAVQALRQAEDLKQRLLTEDSETIITTNKTILLTQLQKAYQNVLLIDLDYALDKKVEQDLWNLGFKHQIESLQNSAKDKKNPRRAESQILLNWSIQTATGFYVSLLHQICSAFKLNLPFRCNIPMILESPQILTSGHRTPQASSCWYICQYCLVHLGDLARYTRQLKMATSFYKQALSVSTSNGQPYNQLGLLRATRGDKLGAAYYHARGLAVGGPFAPAHNNLARMLAQADTVSEGTPVSETDTLNLTEGSVASYSRLNSNLFLMQYMSVHHHILTNGDLEKARKMVKGMSSSLTALVATQQFQHDVLIQICCLSMYSVFSLTESHTLSSETSLLADDEQRWLKLSIDVAAGTLEALLLPVHTTPQSQLLTYCALPAIKILLEWLKLHPEMLGHSAFVSRPQLWPGLCVLLTGLQLCVKDFVGDKYNTVSLPEDDELRGYLPVHEAHSNLRFSNTVSSEIFGDSVIEIKQVLPTKDCDEISEKEIITRKRVGFSASEAEVLKKDKSFVESLRGYRLIELGKWLVGYQKENGTEFITMSIENDVTIFIPKQNNIESDPELVKTIKELSILREKRLSECLDLEGQNTENLSDEESKTVSIAKLNDTTLSVLSTTGIVGTSGDVSPCVEGDMVPSPIIITEADFREKVREKKAGILKPQGSLERARIEKAAMTRVSARDSPTGFVDIQDNQDTGSSCSTVSQDGNICSDVGSLLEPSVPKDKSKKTRTNVALQAILRKQDETSKQVKFLTPVTTPDSISDPPTQLSPSSSKEPEKKILQPKIIKSLTSLPIDRKTGGILSLKNKSGGYPHLQITDDPKSDVSETTVEEGTKHPEGDKKVSSPSKHYKRDGGNQAAPGDKAFAPRYTPWSNNIHNRVDDKSASGRLQTISNFSYFSPPGTAQSMSITLPVVNPKEIDVRSAALQKQKNMYGMGEPYVPNAENFGSEGPHSPYSYWAGPSNPNLHPGSSKSIRPPPRYAKQPNEQPRGQDGQFPTQDTGYGMYNLQPGPQNTWWKLSGSQQDQRFDGRAFPVQGGIPPATNYQTGPNLNASNYQQLPSSYQQQSNFYPQNQADFSNVKTYGSSVHPEPQHFANAGYSSGPYNNFSNYNAPPMFGQGMYPQFSNRFGLPAKTNQTPGEYTAVSYSYDQYRSPNPPAAGQVGYLGMPLQQGSQFSPGYADSSSTSSGSVKFSLDAKNVPENNKMQQGNQGDTSNVYSLFSGSSSAGNESAWPTPSTTQQNVQQSLWSGPGPSPLERLLEQQKHFKYPPNE